MTDQIEEGLALALEAIQDFNFPSEFGLSLISSIPEGFSNSLSDVDILLIVPAGSSFLTTRQMTYIDGRRCEIFIMAMDEMRALASTVEAFGQGTPIEDATAFARDLEMYHRICNGVTIEGAAIVEEALGFFDKGRLRRIACDYDSGNMNRAYNKALFALEFGHHEQARVLAREALCAALSLYCAQQGETNRAEKFLLTKAMRCDLPQSQCDEIRDTIREHATSRDTSGYLRSVERAIASLGIELRTERCSVNPVDGLQCLELWGRSCLADGSRFFVIGREFSEPLQVLFDLERPWATEKLSPDGRDLVGDLFRHGLVQASWPAFDETYRHEASALADLVPFEVACDGILLSAEHEKLRIARLDSSAEALARAGLEVSRAGMIFANAREDAVGAIRCRRWHEVEHAFRSMIQCLCSAAVASTGRVSKPADEWCLPVLSGIPAFETLADEVRDVLTMQVRDVSSAVDMYHGVERCASTLPEYLIGPLLHTFESGMGLWNTVQTMVQWGNYAMNLGVPLLTDEANGEETVKALRDNPVSPYMGTNAMEKLATWSRTDDVLEELGLLG